MSVAVFLLLSLFVQCSNVDATKVPSQDCVFTQWMDFSENCKTGYTVKRRYIVRHSVGDGRKCPNLVMIKPCDRAQPSQVSILKIDDSQTENVGKYAGYGDHSKVMNYGYGNYGYYGKYGYGNYDSVGKSDYGYIYYGSMGTYAY